MELAFDGTASEGNGEMVNYTWTFEHGGVEVSLHGPTPSFVFEREGAYVVTLVVTDEYSGTGRTMFNVTVEVAEDGNGALVWLYVLGTFLLILAILVQLRRRRPSSGGGGNEEA